MQQGTVTLEHALKVFLIDCQARRFTQPTQAFYRGRLGLFVDWCTGQGVAQLQDLTATHIRGYLIELQGKKLSSAYVHSFGRAIRAWLNFCVRDELLTASPFSRVAMPRLEKKILRALTTKEVKQILRYARLERDKALFLFLLDSGVRAAELVALNVGDVDVDTGAVAVRMGKGQKGRNTYIGTRTRKQLLRYFLRERGGMPGPKEPLFLSRNDGARLTYWGLAQLVRRMGLMAGVKDCAPHMLRRTFAINCLRQGMNIHVLAKMMGHADIAPAPKNWSTTNDRILGCDPITMVGRNDDSTWLKIKNRTGYAWVAADSVDTPAISADYRSARVKPLPPDRKRWLMRVAELVRGDMSRLLRADRLRISGQRAIVKKTLRLLCQ